jgi:hypothetical protein
MSAKAVAYPALDKNSTIFTTTANPTMTLTMTHELPAEKNTSNGILVARNKQPPKGGSAIV